MKNQIGFRSFVVIIVALCSFAPVFPQTAANQTDSTGIYGEIKDGLYRNSVFKFQIQFPKEWIVLENKEASDLIKAGIKMADLDEAEMEKNLIHRISLLSVLKEPVGSLDNATAALSAMKQPGSQVNPLQLAKLTRDGLAPSPNFKFNAEPELTKVNGRQFATFDYTITAGDRISKGKYLVTMVGTYSITLFLSYENIEDEKVISNIVDSFKFL